MPSNWEVGWVLLRHRLYPSVCIHVWWRLFEAAMGTSPSGGSVSCTYGNSRDNRQKDRTVLVRECDSEVISLQYDHKGPGTVVVPFLNLFSFVSSGRTSEYMQTKKNGKSNE